MLFLDMLKKARKEMGNLICFDYEKNTRDLFNQRIKNINFSWKEVLSFDGTTGPYVQYTYARAKSILRKYGKEIQYEVTDYQALIDDISFA